MWGSLKLSPPSAGELLPISMLRPSSALYFEGIWPVEALVAVEDAEFSPVEAQPASRATIVDKLKEASDLYSTFKFIVSLGFDLGCSRWAPAGSISAN